MALTISLERPSFWVNCWKEKGLSKGLASEGRDKIGRIKKRVIKDKRLLLMACFISFPFFGKRIANYVEST
jgi:hypothetical protein